MRLIGSTFDVFYEEQHAVIASIDLSLTRKRPGSFYNFLTDGYAFTLSLWCHFTKHTNDIQIEQQRRLLRYERMCWCAMKI